MDTRDENERLLSLPPIEVDTDAALARFRSTVRDRRTQPAGRGGIVHLSLPRVKWLAAAAAAVIVATTLTLTGVAESLLQIFEAKQFAGVTVVPTDLQTLSQLTAYGTITWSAQPSPHEVASLAAATTESGLPAVSVTLPAGVGTTARYGVVDRTTAKFVFDATKAQQSAATIGRTAPPMPARIDGSTLVFGGGPAIVQTYGDVQGASGPTVVVIVSRPPTVSSDGVTVSELRSYLLSLPDVSAELAAQIRAIGDPATTLPVPIPMGQAASKSVGVHGTTGLFVGDSTGLGSGVIWQQNGLVYLVGGTLTEAQTMAVANSLR